ncbi:MAG TPA: signal peptidase I [Candidatus Saccharimonadaceae bacterium]|nr:signal peptidase I [Candidatus Saccharimonadaceae bacterium]
MEEASYFDRHPHMRDLISLIVFVACVVIGTLFINTYIFRSFSVSGLSSWPTLHNGDRLIVDRIPVTWDQLQNKTYSPQRGQFIVFKNPQWTGNGPDEYVIKRVIAFGGERVVVKNGTVTVYNSQHPDGFNPDALDKHGTPRKPTSGEVDQTVDPGTLFVMGDNRIGANSEDSRDGLGLIPLSDVIGPVSWRIFPFTSISTF